ncbi:protein DETOXIFICATION 27-like isoform X2 [Ipomoea triloba]|uniref:protein DETOXIFICATION 27-like isoform X2 n=1 Tax=Ipomoea triloba TaxID=35885 RepID=UPI00125CE8EE|nr:protein DETOXIFICATION 27-like isoform X2 [Ipomoea triloba]
MSSNGISAENKVPFLTSSSSEVDTHHHTNLSRRIWVETKKLWHIVGPAIFTRVSSYSTMVIAQAFAGHVGDVELAAMSITTNLIVGFNYGLMLGMASALETLCGQAYGAKRYHMLGVYLQRCWVVLWLVSLAMIPLYLYATPVLKLLGQPEEVSELSGSVALALLPIQFSFASWLPVQRFLQCQLKNFVVAWISVGALIVHILINWFIVYQLKLGIIATALALSFTWWLIVVGLFVYTVSGGCPLTWTGFSMEAFSDLWAFFKLSISSGIMLCMNINTMELMIPLAFFAGTGVRVANELGAGNGKAARFASIVSVMESIGIGIVFWVLIIFFHNQLALIFTTSQPILDEVHKLSLLLAFTILLNSVQPILSGVAVGSGWQAYVAYINLGCYYLFGVPFGLILGWVFNKGVMGVWGGMIGGTALQTLVLAVITIRTDWNNEARNANKLVEKWDAVHHVKP